MTYSALIKSLAMKLGLPKTNVEAVVSGLFEEITLVLCNGQKVKIPRFGTIETRRKKNSQNAGYIKIVQSRLMKQLLNLVNKHNKGEYYG